MMGQPLILTLSMGDREAAYFNGLRRAHFPAERNFIDAHLTIFHHLPAADVDAATNTTAPIEYRLTGLRMLGHGVAYSASSPRLSELRARLALRFDAWLTPQDRAGFSPHITVQK
jgi:hypothetical protein